MYKLSKKLIEKLNRHNIRYCHWKSNLLFRWKALGGYDDLDFPCGKRGIIKIRIWLDGS